MTELQASSPRFLLWGERVPEMFPKEILAPLGTWTLSFGTSTPPMLNGGLAMKTNETSVIQSGDICDSVYLGASSIVNTTTISKMDSSQSAIRAEV